MKRFFDIILSLLGLLFLLPFISFILLFVWFKDKANPLYIAKRVGVYGKEFKMIKIRTMVVDADQSGVDSTSINDKRITKIGSILRKYKVDELPQLINILFGEMSFVGPRPSIKRDTDLYTKVEKKLFKIRPGITDFASIVYSDESIILADSLNPDLSYHQLIRPGKSRLGLFYVQNNNLFMDICLIIITLLGLISRKYSLKMVSFLLLKYGASKKLIDIASRRFPLLPESPPGSDMITQSRRV